MKRALWLPPLLAAILFAVPETLQLYGRDDAGYIPVVYEVLILVFGFLAAALLNLVLIVPLCLLVRLKSSSLFAGAGLGLVVSLLGATVAYAFEVFGYQTSILHAAYLYPILLPLLALTLASFFCLTRVRRTTPARVPNDSDDGGNGDDSNR